MQLQIQMACASRSPGLWTRDEPVLLLGLTRALHTGPLALLSRDTRRTGERGVAVGTRETGLRRVRRATTHTFSSRLVCQTYLTQTVNGAERRRRTSRARARRAHPAHAPRSRLPGSTHSTLSLLSCLDPTKCTQTEINAHALFQQPHTHTHTHCSTSHLQSRARGGCCSCTRTASSRHSVLCGRSTRPQQHMIQALCPRRGYERSTTARGLRALLSQPHRCPC